jgi:hypothetical protein
VSYVFAVDEKTILLSWIERNKEKKTEKEKPYFCSHVFNGMNETIFNEQIF